MNKSTVELLRKSKGNLLSEAEAIKSALDLGVTQMEIARVFDADQSQISRRLAILNLIPELKKRAHEGNLNIKTACELSKTSPIVQKEIADRFSDVDKKIINILRGSTAAREVTCPKCKHKFSVIP